ncbi:MAG TPA: multidrug efflux RND transporter permease subunit [Acetobacteraceae bacterium]|nr:multidrug efflux RND transporter permease subunit [Acetobacteraceae bacterium]
MLSGFFIHRPKFAIVISIVITLAGLLALTAIPVSQYPNVTPPQVSVSVTYPGASADTIMNTVAQPIEEQVNGVPDMLYMQSTSSSSGTYTLTVTFAIGSDPNIDQVNVQNRVQLAEAELPSVVEQEGITVRSSSSSFVLAVNLYSTNNKYNQVFISNYAYMHLQQEVARISGVGNTQIFGERQYAMRVWLNPVRMTALKITPSDVVSAIESQNIQVAAGQIGQPPVVGDQQQQLTVLAPGELSNPQQFEDIIIRTNPNGGVVRIHDIGSVQLAAQQYTSTAALDGNPSATLAVYQTPNANALGVAQAVEKQMKTLSQQFPPGLEYAVVYNATAFVSANIAEILRTLVITLALVVGVVFIFLQDWRATLIPTVAIPVSLIGVFAVLYVLGYSANTVDLFAIVLAITLVVDDAIVVVENVTRHLEEDPQLPPAVATERAMAEITGPVVATTLVLVAVFAPVGFVSGVTGALYRQFAVTISVSVVISGINALTLSPALCALVLRPPRKARFAVFRWFNGGFDKARSGYAGAVRVLARRLLLGSLALTAMFGVTWLLFARTPSSFLPNEDQGYFFINVQTPDGASLERTQAVIAQVDGILRKTPGVAHAIGLGGFSLVAGAQEPNAGSVIAIMRPWAQRGASESVSSVIAKLAQSFNAIPSADVVSFAPPAIQGISTTGGINFVLEARNGESDQQLASAGRALIFAANQNPNLHTVFTSFSAAVPQVLVTVDNQRAQFLGVTPAAIYQTLEADLGSQFVNDFNYQNFVFQVIIQAQQQFREKISDIDNLYVRSAAGAMVPLSAVVKISTVQGADAINAYNEYRAVLINGSSAPGKSTGQAIAAMEQVAAQHMPKGFGYDWTGMSYQELVAAGQEGSAFLFAVVFSYLFLVALYESWTLPLSVMLPVVLAVLGGLAALMVRGMALDVYGQIGLVLLIGLAAKNAILIVEFAKDRLERGDIAVLDAGEEAARTRYRPVMMTALAFVIGVLPLVFATGAGAGGRQSIGTTVFGGMILASFIGILFVPMLFVGFEELSERAGRLFRRRQTEHPAE